MSRLRRRVLSNLRADRVGWSGDETAATYARAGDNFDTQPSPAVGRGRGPTLCPGVPLPAPQPAGAGRVRDLLGASKYSAALFSKSAAFLSREATNSSKEPQSYKTTLRYPLDGEIDTTKLRTYRLWRGPWMPCGRASGCS